MEPYMRHWEVTVKHARECADYLRACRDRLEECSSMLGSLERDFKYMNLLHYSSKTGVIGAPWEDLEAALRRFAMAPPTENLVDLIERISEAFMKLKVGLLDKEDAFNLYVSTASTTDESHRSDFHYLVTFKIRLLEFKDAMERSHATFSRALRKRRQQPPVRGDAAERECLGAPATESPERAGDSRQNDAKKGFVPADRYTERKKAGRARLGGDPRTVLLGIWRMIGEDGAAATVTCRQLADDPVVKEVLIRGHNNALHRLKLKRYVARRKGAWSLTRLGREVCRRTFDS